MQQCVRAAVRAYAGNFDCVDVPCAQTRGGGYGPAQERPAEDVAEDVRQGYVSVKAAAERYGVVVDPQTFTVDEAATAKLRSARAERATAAAGGA